MTLSIIIFEPPTGGAPRPFSLLVNTQPGTAGGCTYIFVEICTCLIHIYMRYCYRTVSPDDYEAVVNELIQFNVGDVRVNHTIIINQDEICENDPDEFFFSDITFNSGMQPINVIRETATITIDDSIEPECSKSHLFPLNTYIEFLL